MPAIEDDVTLIKVGNRIYRRYCTPGTASFLTNRQPTRVDSYRVAQIVSCSTCPVEAGEDEEAEEQEREEELPPEEVSSITEKTIDADGYKIKIGVPAVYHRFIIGRGGRTLQVLQKQTGTTITIPPRGKKIAEVVIVGPSESNVMKAKQQIDTIISTNKAAQEPYTHFLSLPLNHEHMQKAIQQLQDRILQIAGSESGLDPSLFIKPSKVHLTVLMLRIDSAETMQKIIELLDNEVRNKINEMFTTQDQLTLKNLNIMNSNAYEAHVLYAEVEESETRRSIIEFIEYINDLFTRSGISTTRDVIQNSNLHATIVNSKYRRSNGGVDNNNAKRIAFDATTILSTLGHAEIGTCSLRTLELSALKKPVDPRTGYYHCEYRIAFPSLDAM